jgi:hypothetical protein
MAALAMISPKTYRITYNDCGLICAILNTNQIIISKAGGKTAKATPRNKIDVLRI